VKLTDAAGTAQLTALAFDAGFRGGARVAAGDVTGDGVPDLVAGAGPGGGPHVRAFDVAAGEMVRDYFAFDPSFRGGVNVAAGDVDGDGTGDVVTAAGAGGGPHLRVWRNGQLAAESFAYDATFTGGMSVAVGDFNKDGKADIAVGPLTGGPARLRVLSGTLASIKDIEVYQDDYRGGTTLAMRDTDGDGGAELLVGVKDRGRPKVIGVKPTGTPADAMTPDAAVPEAVFIG